MSLRFINVRKIRTWLFCTTLFLVALDIIGGTLFALDSLGNAAAFTVGTALLSTPIWGLQGFLVLFWPKHYTANEWLWSLLGAIYMACLIVGFFTLAIELNFLP
jgi:hypothetical protein